MAGKRNKEKEKAVIKIAEQFSPDKNIIKLVSVLKEQADEKMTRVYYMTKIIELNP